MAGLSTSWKVMSTLALLEEAEGASGSSTDSLFRFVRGDLGEEIKGYSGKLRRRIKGGKQREVAEILRLRPSASILVRDIHPGWILEWVKGESPYVIGLVCRFLPGNQVRHIIEHLPNDLRSRLPAMSESFSIPNELVFLVRQFLSKRFSCIERPPLDATFSPRHIPWMNSRDIKLLIKELGYEEIRAAFRGVEAKIFRAFLARFPISEAREMKNRMETGRPVTDLSRKRAQKHLAETSFDVQSPEDLSFEIGLSTLAYSIGKEDLGWIEAVVFKLDPRFGYSLRRYVKERVAGSDTKQVSQRREDLLELVRDLTDRNVIASYWARKSSEETTQDFVEE